MAKLGFEIAIPGSAVRRATNLLYGALLKVKVYQLMYPKCHNDYFAVSLYVPQYLLIR